MKIFKFVQWSVCLLFLPFFTYGFSTIDSLQKILTSTDSLEHHPQYIQTSIAMGNALLEVSKYEAATAHFKAASSLATRYDLAEDRYLADLKLARTYERQGKFNLLSDLCGKILTRIPRQDPRKRGEILRIYGAANIYQGDFETAYGAQMEALDIYITLRDSVGLEKVYFGLGNNFFYQNQSELAKKNYQKALKISYDLGLTNEIANSLNALGSIASYEEDFETALSLNEEALDIFIKKEDQPSIAWTTYNIGSILHNLGRSDEGLAKLNECKVMCDAINEVALQGYVLTSMGIIYSEKNKLDQAVQCFEASYRIAEENNDQSSILELLEAFADVYYRKQDLVMYRFYQDKSSAVKDSIYNQDLISSISDLKKDFEITQLQKEKEIESLKNEKQLQQLSFKNRLWIGVALFILLISFGCIMFVRQKNTKERNTLLENKNNEIERQVQLLKASNQDLVKYTEIISHDLREPLRNLSGFTFLLKRELKAFDISDAAEDYMNFIKGGANQMEKILEGISNYSKLSTEMTSKEAINVNELIQEVINDLAPLANDTQAQFEIQNLPTINFDRAHIYQVFFNLLSNAINFRSEHPPLIQVDCLVQADHLLFSVSDNGVGIPEEFHKDIFVVFQRLQDRGKYTGAGLGLPTCKK
ncbi:MAG: tetratricopeptide repeat protein, partial [Bacteroidota bacterium]